MIVTIVAPSRVTNEPERPMRPFVCEPRASRRMRENKSKRVVVDRRRTQIQHQYYWGLRIRAICFKHKIRVPDVSPLSAKVFDPAFLHRPWGGLHQAFGFILQEAF